MEVKAFLKGFWFRLKIFGWYLLTEPIRQFKELGTVAVHLLDALNKTLTIGYMCLVFMTIALFLGDKFWAAFFLCLLLFVVLLWEWERGFFMQRYRDKIRKNVEMEVRANERNK